MTSNPIIHKKIAPAITPQKNSIFQDITSAVFLLFLFKSLSIAISVLIIFDNRPSLIYHTSQACTTADYRFLIIFGNGRGLWYFQFGTNFLRFFQGSSMVIFSVFNSKPRLLFWAILSSKRDLLRFFSHFFVKVFAKVGGEILCFYSEKRRIWLYCAVCFCNYLISKVLHKSRCIKVADL